MEYLQPYSVPIEVSKPKTLYCTVGEIKATINVTGGELVDYARGYVTEVCDGCKHWSDESVQKLDDKTETEWGPGSVHQGRLNRLEQHIVEQARFIPGVKRKLVIARCTPLGAR